MSDISKTSVIPAIANLISAEASESWRDLVSAFCANVLLVWDIAITFDLEVELIWRSPKSVVAYLFLLNRYISLSQVIMTMVFLQGDFKTNHNICRVFVLYYAFSTVLLLWISDILLVYRAYAFCGQDRKILIVLIILWIINGVAIGVMSVFVVKTFSVFHSNMIILRVVGECVAMNLPRLLHYIWVSELIFQSILFFLVTGRCIQQTVISWNGTMRPNDLYHIFARDGLWVYGLLLGMFIVSATQTNIAGLSLLQWAITYAEVGSSRLILNLRSFKTPHAISSEYIVSFPRWTGREMVFDTITESDDIVPPEGSVELQDMEGSEES